MIEPVSNQSAQLQPALDPLTPDEQARSDRQNEGAQPSQQQGSSGLTPPPIVNRYALAFAQQGPNAKVPTATVSPATSSAQAAACKPSAPASSAAQAPSRSVDSGVLGWVEHTAGAVSSRVTGAAKSAINGVVDAQRATDKVMSQAGGVIDSGVNSAEHRIDNARAWLRQNGGVAGQVASNNMIGVNEGAALGLYGMGKGVVQMAHGASELVNPVEWAANPHANIERIQCRHNERPVRDNSRNEVLRCAMTIPMEKILGGPIGFDKTIPGTVVREGREVVYFSDDGKTDFNSQFERLTKNVNPRHATRGGKTSQGCRLWLPDGTLFHPVSYHGDVEGWRKDIEAGARQLNLLLARVEGNRLVVSDGRSFALADCKVKFD
jgi:hypothetical protein